MRAWKQASEWSDGKDWCTGSIYAAASDSLFPWISMTEMENVRTTRRATIATFMANAPRWRKPELSSDLKKSRVNFKSLAGKAEHSVVLYDRNKWRPILIPLCPCAPRPREQNGPTLFHFKKPTTSCDPTSASVRGVQLRNGSLPAAAAGSDDCALRVHRPGRRWKMIRELGGCSRVCDWSNWPS